jgi:ATP-dependent DNA helicase RecG
MFSPQHFKNKFMNEKELKKLLENLLKKGECEYIEFKKDFFILDQFFEYYSALSNSATLVGEDFGYLVYGVSDDGGICGTTVNKEEGKLKERITKVFGNSHDFEIFKFEYKEKNITIYKIPCAKAKIASFKNKKTDAYESFYRVGSSNKSIAKSDDFQKIYKKIALFEDDWSAIICEESNIDDLDFEALKLAKNHYQEKYPSLEVKDWSNKKFLEKLGLIRDSKLTNACLVLLGKKESNKKLKNSILSVEIVWRLDTSEEKADQSFYLPLILATSQAWSFIRNPKYKIITENTKNELIAREVDKYDQKVFLEALHNCIAHQDYYAGERITILEKIDKLIFTNAGNFFDGKAEDYVLERKNIASKYRNKALVDAMKELGMIDKLGSGVKTMYETLRKKTFPFPTYDYDKGFDETKLEIYGKEIDKKFTEILMNKSDLDFNTTIILDKIQKNKIDEIDKKDLKKLREQRLIEKIGKEYILSSKVAEIIGKEAEYTEKKGFTDDYIIEKIIKHLENFKDGLKRNKINDFAWKYLPGVLSDEQKKIKINNILQKLKKEGFIKNFGTDRIPIWKFLKK